MLPPGVVGGAASDEAARRVPAVSEAGAGMAGRAGTASRVALRLSDRHGGREDATERGALDSEELVDGDADGSGGGRAAQRVQLPPAPCFDRRGACPMPGPFTLL
jgi:hypothetical protein